jgi:hypothetical protein
MTYKSPPPHRHMSGAPRKPAGDGPGAPNKYLPGGGLLRDAADLYRVDSGFACFAVLVHNGAVVGGAPIAKYMGGWSMRQLRDYCIKRRWALTGPHEKTEESNGA